MATEKKKPAAKKPATKKKTTATKSAPKKKAAAGLHYDKDALNEHYTDTFNVVMRVTGILVGATLLYFIFLAVFLGDEGHTKHKPFYDQFKERIDIEYDGLKLPYYPEEESE